MCQMSRGSRGLAAKLAWSLTPAGSAKLAWPLELVWSLRTYLIDEDGLIATAGLIANVLQKTSLGQLQSMCMYMHIYIEFYTGEHRVVQNDFVKRNRKTLSLIHYGRELNSTLVKIRYSGIRFLKRNSCFANRVYVSADIPARRACESTANITDS